MTYNEYLHTEAWANKRQLRIMRAGWHCECCKAKPDFFHVHHLTYANLFNEPIGDLMALCKSCHERIERAISEGELSRDGDAEKLRHKTIMLFRRPSKPSPSLLSHQERQRIARIEHAERLRREMLASQVFAKKRKEMKKTLNGKLARYHSQEKYGQQDAPRIHY